MRIALTLVLFVVIGATLAGSAITALLSAPISTEEVWNYFPWLAAGGFAVALLVSYFLAGNLIKRIGKT